MNIQIGKSIRQKLTILTALFILVMVVVSVSLAYNQYSNYRTNADRLAGTEAVARLWPVLNSYMESGLAGTKVIKGPEAGKLMTAEFQGDSKADHCVHEAANSKGAMRIRFQRAFSCIDDEYGIIRSEDPIVAGLAMKATEQLPDLVTRLVGLKSSIRTANRKSSLNPFDKMMFMVNAGMFKVLADRIVRDMKNPELAQFAEPEMIKAFTKASLRFQGGAGKFGTALSGENYKEELVKLNLDERFLKLTMAASDLQGALLNNLHNIVEEKRDAAFTNLVAGLSVLVGLVIVTMVVCSQILKSIMRRIDGLRNSILEIADNNLDAAIPQQNGGDEIAAIANAVDHLRSALKNEITQQQDKSREQADVARAGALQRISDEFETQIGGLLQQVSSDVNNLQSAAETVGDMVDSTKIGAERAASFSKEARAQMKHASGAATNVRTSMQDIRVQADTMASEVSSANDQAKGAVQQVEDLAQSANAIGEIVALIRDIAEQTNLLALNATIEAARAGDAGKGFAVVAGEVKSLSDQTAKATEQISTQISKVQDGTKGVVETIQQVAASLLQNEEKTGAMSGSVVEQVNEAETMGDAVERTSNEMNKVGQQMDEMQQAVSQAAETSNSMSDLAGALVQRSDELQQVVDTFKRNLVATN